MNSPYAAPGGDGFAPRRSGAGLLVVVGLHLVLFWALASGLARRVVDVVKAPIETRLIKEQRPPPPPPPVALPVPQNVPPPTAVMPVPQVVPLVTPPPSPNAITAPPPPPPPPPPAAEPVRAPPPPPAPTPPPAPPPAAAAPARNPQDVYLAELRSYVNGIKRYPTSREARQLRPQGTVRVWIEIDRNGQLLGSGVEGTSGALLLDNEALRTVRNGRFPAFPAEAFAGQPSHRFVIPIEYLLEGS